MDALKNYREKIKSIEKLVNKMESGELSINELVELEGLTRDLHERSIILKYKAFENRTGGSATENQESEIEIEAEEADAQHQEEETGSDSQESEILFESEETPTMDFSIFDAPADEKADEPQKVEEEHKVEEVASEPVKAESKEEEVTAKVEAEKPESTSENEFQHTVSSSSEPAAEIAHAAAKHEATIHDEINVEPEVKPEPIAEEPKVVVKEKGTSFLDRLNITDNSISSQLAGRKIDSLSGAFGINERLLYINQLFDGSGEEFSDAIKTLDSQPGLDEASTKVEELAFKNSWDPEEDTVLEFLAIIKRRYA